MDTTKAFPASINQRYGRRCRYIGFAIKSNTTEIVKHTTVRNRENIASNNNDNKTKKKEHSWPKSGQNDVRARRRVPVISLGNLRDRIIVGRLSS